MAGGAWNHTAQLCAVTEIYHAGKATKFSPDKWHPMKFTPDSLTTGQRRELMRKQGEKTFEAFRKLRGKRR